MSKPKKKDDSISDLRKALMNEKNYTKIYSRQKWRKNKTPSNPNKQKNTYEEANKKWNAWNKLRDTMSLSAMAEKCLIIARKYGNNLIISFQITNNSEKKFTIHTSLSNAN